METSGTAPESKTSISSRVYYYSLSATIIITIKKRHWKRKNIVKKKLNIIDVCENIKYNYRFYYCVPLMKLTNVISNIVFEKVKSLKYDKVLSKIFLINIFFVFTGIVFFIFSINNLNSEFFTSTIIALCIIF